MAVKSVPWECKCARCGHEWSRRIKTVPHECPKCKSYSWNDSSKGPTPIDAKIAKSNPTFSEAQKNAK